MSESGAPPVELTHFVGREREMASLRELARAVRLLTLTGAGGSGKSRLALQLVPDLAGDVPDGVFWVELAPLMEERLIAGAILLAFGSPAEGGAATADAIIERIGQRSLTIVLDNCEHLIDACATLADTLLRACPNLRIIATSREALGVAGERAWLVPALALPAPDADLAELAAADAVRLFVDRALDVHPGFALSPATGPIVADICIRLDGIPLAIELAAARVRHLSAEQIRGRLSDAFSLLTSGSRTALPRHRTLRAAIDWSHDLLPDEARVVLRRVAVFRGGFTLDLVEQVAAGDGIASCDVLDLIAVLADRSMIMVRETAGDARYHLLDTMRQYATQRLEESGEAARVRGAFATAVIARVAAAEPHFTTRARRHAFAQLDPDIDNIREVLAWTHDHEPEQHIRLVGMLWWYWFSTRHWVEAHRWLTAALALPAARQPTRERAALLFGLGALAALRAQGQEAKPLLEEAVQLAADMGDGKLEAYALNYLAMVYSASLSPTALEYTRRAERWLRAHDDEYGLRLSLLLSGMAEHGAGNTAVARTMMEEAIHIARRFGQDRELAVALQTYATILLPFGEESRAETMVRESLEALRRDPSFLFIARAVDYYAYSRADRAPERAARDIGIAAGMRQHIGAQRFPHDEVLIGALIERLRERLGADTFERAFDDGHRVQPADAIDEVIGTDGTAHDDASAAHDDVAAPNDASAVPDDVAAHDDASAAEEAAAMADALRDVASAAPPVAVDGAVDLDVRALGRLAVTVRGMRIETWPYAKPKEMLAYLVLRPQGRTRSEIGAALWPGAAPAQVRNSFHVTMHHVRRTLGHADWVILADDRYRIAPTVRVAFDVTLFQERIRSAMAISGAAAITPLRDALSLYRDHFLADEPFGSWRDEIQDGLRRTYCDAGLRLGALLAAGEAFDEAAAVYEQVVACEPLHEAAHRGLLITLTRAGSRAHALRHYERLTALLLELELEPEEETLELHERIRTADIVPLGSDGAVAM